MKAYIATHNVYGVDLNPTAIELGKLSLWLNVIHKDMETPFFANRLTLGNAVIGAWLKVYSKQDVYGIFDRRGSTAKVNKWWEKAKEYANKVIGSGYELNTRGLNGWSAYQMLFMGDNGETAAAKEAIFPILQDSKTIRSYGNSLFLIASTFNDKMHASPFDPAGINGCVSAAWGGNRARKELVLKFFPTGNVPQVPSYDMPAYAGDERAIFWGYSDDENSPVTLENTKISDFKNGYGVCKFLNFKTDGSSAYNLFLCCRL